MPILSVLEFEAANGSTTVTDTVDAVNWTRTVGSNAAEISTADSRSGSSCLLLEEGSSYNRDFGTSSPAIYVDGWFKPAPGATGQIVLFEVRDSNSNYSSHVWYDMTTDKIMAYGWFSTQTLYDGSDPNPFNADILPSVGDWVHIALVKNENSSSARWYINTVPVGNAIYWLNFGFSQVTLGAKTATASGATGTGNFYADDIRVSNEITFVPGSYNTLPSPPTPTIDLALSLYTLPKTELIKVTDDVYVEKSIDFQPLILPQLVGGGGGDDGGTGPAPPSQYWG